MDMQTVLLIGSGIVLQSIALALSAQPANLIRNIAGIMGGSLVAFFIGDHGAHPYNLTEHVGIYFFVYMLLFSIAYSSAILPIINENSLLLFNMLFLASLISFIVPDWSQFTALSPFIQIPLEILMIPTLVVVINAFLPYPTSREMKLAFYVWYLVMATCILSFSLYYYATQPNFMLAHSFFSQVALFTFGMVFLNLFIDIFNVFALIPFQGKHETREQALERARKQRELLCSKYVDDEIDYRIPIFIVVSMVGFVIFNHYVTKVDDQLAINIALLSGRYLFGSHFVQPKQDITDDNSA